MSAPQLKPLQPTWELWCLLWLEWHREWIAFYCGPHKVEPVTASDPDVLRTLMSAAEPLLPCVWPVPVTPAPGSDAGNRLLTPGELASRGGQGRRPPQGTGGWLG
ncbi:hypothetical protein ACFWYW_02300 [Nonomuraea sp. NPDC059023]|uniref:hypothetical protein n=1 Tax=unclassified Nonomuraea TaxID=2593643 RepID=UPI003695D976